MVDRASSRAGEAGAGAELSMEDMCRALLIVRSKGNLKKIFCRIIFLMMCVSSRYDY